MSLALASGQFPSLAPVRFAHCAPVLALGDGDLAVRALRIFALWCLEVFIAMFFGGSRANNVSFRGL